MNRWCAKQYSITPYYVLWNHLEQYPGMRWALVIIPTHIISDVYLGMVRLTVFCLSQARSQRSKRLHKETRGR